VKYTDNSFARLDLNWKMEIEVLLKSWSIKPRRCK